MEVEFRKRVNAIFNEIEEFFEGVDPDIAECEQSQGSLTVTLSDGSKCILSVQPSVQQIWLALASRGTAYHFDFVEDLGKWMDDKGRGVELIQCLNDFFKDVAGITLLD